MKNNSSKGAIVSYIKCRCGHENTSMPSRKLYKLLLSDSLPDCERCGRRIHSSEFMFPHNDLMDEVRSELDQKNLFNSF